MNTMNHLSEDDLVLFALQLLEGGELENTLNHLERCEQCRHEVARFQGDLSMYALSQTELHTPPAAARERLMRRVEKEKKIVPPAPVAAPVEVPRAPVASLPQYDRSSTAVPIAATNLPPLPPRFAGNPVANDEGDVFLPARGRRIFGVEAEEFVEDEKPRRSGNGLLTVLGWTGWAIAAGMAVVAGLQFRERQAVQSDMASQQAQLQSTQGSLTDLQSALDTLTDNNAMQVSLHVPVNGQPEPPKPEGHAAYNAQKGSLLFIANHLAEIPANKTYELWVLPAGGQDPIPAGTFRPDTRGVASVVMPQLPKGVAAKGFGVTIEDQGGSKTPTPPIVLAGL
ncbi:anti-sigma factor domain-containing protein [Granulicella cerasi]|uniref:Regulator of SigK n=2 Tax=Granulicella cerasi TaxID=741063 RepID=A0ABW1Z9N0_9BACT|nr:anti-sigma factor [Granulicella cerasi]